MIDSSGVDITFAEKVLSGMPLMQNSRDIEAMYIYHNDTQKRQQACANGVAELLRLLGESLFRVYDEPEEYDENILECFIDLLKAVMPDEDYGKSFNHIIYVYGYLGVKKYLSGDEEEAIRCFEEEVRLAKAFDSLPEICVSTSPAVNGAIFEKTKTNLGTSKMQSRVKHLLTNRYPLSEAFKEKPVFKKLINSIEC
ncbi:MAG: tetratricopeptide repeat protein [Clostridia bacterium]|nr:tetratricopeptide repeat protein [Clostridia bacterium]